MGVRHMCTRVYSYIYIYIVIIIITLDTTKTINLLCFACNNIHRVMLLSVALVVSYPHTQLSTHNSQLADYVHYITLRWLLTYYLLPYL